MKAEEYPWPPTVKVVVESTQHYTTAEAGQQSRLSASSYLLSASSAISPRLLITFSALYHAIPQSVVIVGYTLACTRKNSLSTGVVNFKTFNLTSFCTNEYVLQYKLNFKKTMLIELRSFFHQIIHYNLKILSILLLEIIRIPEFLV